MEYVFKVCSAPKNEELNALFASAWTSHKQLDMLPLLNRALVYVCAYDEGKLVGFAKVVSDGGIHGFLLDPTVAPEKQRQGIGRQLVEMCAQEAKRRGVEWLHVDFEPRLAEFYAKCGFADTRAGLRNLRH